MLGSLKSKLFSSLLNIFIPGLGLLYLKKRKIGIIFTIISVFIILCHVMNITYPTVETQQMIQLIYLFILIISIVLSFIDNPKEESLGGILYFLKFLLPALCFYVLILFSLNLSFDWRRLRENGILYVLDWKNIYYPHFMTPAIMPGAWLYTEILTDSDSINRGDIVGYLLPENDRNYSKHLRYSRVIGLPGESITVLKSIIFINNKMLYEPWLNYGVGKNRDFDKLFSKLGTYTDIVLGSDEYFLMVDDRFAFSDSRFFGSIKKCNIKKRVKYTQNTIFSYNVKDYFPKDYPFNFAVSEVNNTRWFLIDPAVLNIDSTSSNEDSISEVDG